jgi:hypothetical protein
LRLSETPGLLRPILFLSAKDVAAFRFKPAAAVRAAIEISSACSSSEIGSSGLFFLSDRSHGIPLSVTAEGKEGVVEECWPAA